MQVRGPPRPGCGRRSRRSRRPPAAGSCGRSSARPAVPRTGPVRRAGRSRPVGVLTASRVRSRQARRGRLGQLHHDRAAGSAPAAACPLPAWKSFGSPSPGAMPASADLQRVGDLVGASRRSATPSPCPPGRRTAAARPRTCRPRPPRPAPARTVRGRARRRPASRRSDWSGRGYTSATSVLRTGGPGGTSTSLIRAPCCFADRRPARSAAAGRSRGSGLRGSSFGDQVDPQVAAVRLPPQVVVPDHAVEVHRRRAPRRTTAPRATSGARPQLVGQVLQHRVGLLDRASPPAGRPAPGTRSCCRTGAS